MTREIINKGTSANDGTGDSIRSFATKTNNNFSELYNILGGDSAVRNTKFGSNQIIFDGASILDAHETTLAVTTPTKSNVITFPDSSGDVLLSGVVQTITNKTLITPILTTPKINDTTGHTYDLAVSNLAANRVITLPLLGAADEFVFKTHAVTLVNKTLTSPVINTGRVGTSLNDTSGNELIKVTATSSAVNEITLANAASNNDPTITASGGSTNIGIKLAAKGTGSIELTKAAFSSVTMTSAGTVDKTATLVICNKSSGFGAILADGTTVGEYKIFTNKNSGAATVTPANFAQGTSFALAQNDGCQCIWDGANWFLIGNQGEITIA